MEYKISYPQKWDDNGTHYNQLVRVSIGEREAVRLNVLAGDRHLEKMDDNGYLFTDLHLRDVLAHMIGCDTDERYIDRNTVFKFEPI